MLHFFKICCSADNTDIGKDERFNVLFKLQTIAQIVKISNSSYANFGSISTPADPKKYFNLVNGLFSSAKRMNGNSSKLLTIDIALDNDLKEWSINEINTLPKFYEFFKDFPIKLRIDSEKITSLEIEKRKAFFQSMKESTIRSIRIASYRSSNQSENKFNISNETLILLHTILPDISIEQAIYLDSQRGKNILTQLLYADRTSKISIFDANKYIKETEKEEQKTQKEETTVKNPSLLTISML